LEHLQTIRLRRPLSIEGLAKLAGVSTRTIMGIEHGETVPKIRTIARLCTALGVTPADVIEFSQKQRGGKRGG